MGVSVLVGLLGILALAAGAHAGVVFVDANAATGGDGSSWSKALKDLQSGLAATQSGDQIWIAAGTYKPDGGTLGTGKHFAIPGGVALYGGFAGTEWTLAQRNPDLNETILSGDLLGDDGPGFQNYEDNSYRVVRVDNATGKVLLDGLNIQGGQGDPLSLLNKAAGLYVKNSSLDVSNCCLRLNRSDFGVGGMWIDDDTSVVNIDRCTFADNYSGVFSAAVMIMGATARITRSRFLANLGEDAGAVEISLGAKLLLDECQFTGNQSHWFGAGLRVLNGTATVTNCTFSANVTGVGGAAVALTGGSAAASIANCILWGDIAPDATAGSVEIFNIVGTLSLDFSNVTGPIAQFGGTSNSEENPLLVDADGPDDISGTLDDDCRLASDSPCIDQGSNQALPADSLDADHDGDVAEPMPLDLRDVGRFEDDPETTDPPGQSAPVVDRGACEFSRWTNLGYSVGGDEAPVLVGNGSWLPGFPLGVTITGAKQGKFGVLFVGSFAILAPFKGGVLVPFPLFTNGVLTDGAGQTSVQDVLPANAPPGLEVFLQAWLGDVEGPVGLASTNAVHGQIP